MVLYVNWKQSVVEHLSGALRDMGYALFDASMMRSVIFDILARREDDILIIKVVTNIDTIRRETTEEIEKISSVIKAKPIIIGLKNSSGPLEDGVVYIRHDLPVVTYPTFHTYLVQDGKPYVFAAPGGYYVTLDNNTLSMVKKERGLSLNTLANIAGVSRKAIQMYERGEMCATIDVALRLEDYLGVELIKPIEIMKVYDYQEGGELPEDPFEQEVYRTLHNMGYRIYMTSKCPFDWLSEYMNVFITSLARSKPEVREKMFITEEISEVIGVSGVVISHRKFIEKNNKKSVAFITLEELYDIDSEEEMRDLITDTE